MNLFTPRRPPGAIAFAAILSLSGALSAQPATLSKAKPEVDRPADKTQIVKLVLHPAAAPVPAMKYQLLPEVRDLKPGNAALLYQRAQSLEWWGDFTRKNGSEKIGDLLDMPLAKMPHDKTLLLHNPLREMDLAARREYCDWELTPRLRTDGYALLIPDIQMFRTFGRMLALRVRLDLVDGQMDQAQSDMQTGFALSRHVSETPFLIGALVGNAIGNMMLNQVEEYVQFAKAPNLYWALADLPKPFMDLRRAMQGEKLGIDSLFPEIRAALNDPSLPPVAPHNISKSLDHFRHLNNSAPGQDWRLAATMMAARTFPVAKKYLLEKGFPTEQVEAMPVTQVSLMYAVALFDKSFDEFYKWQSFPYWQAAPQLARAEESFHKTPQDMPEAMHFAASLMPSVQRVMFAKARTERRIALLQIVEALRLYAAAEGKLPKRLQDIVSVPIPLDPVTGKAFDYTLTATGATLIAAAPAGQTASEQNSVRYEVTLARSAKQ